MMRWEDVGRDSAAAMLEHWRKLGRFRRAHPAVGAGVHRTLQAAPYIFSRRLETRGGVDRVMVAMDQGAGVKRIPVFGVFPEGTGVVDEYSGARGTVRADTVALTTEWGLVLLAERR